MPELMAAYSSSARSVSISVIELLTSPCVTRKSSVSCEITSTRALPIPTTSRLASAVIRARLATSRGTVPVTRDPRRPGGQGAVATVVRRVRQPPPAPAHRPAPARYDLTLTPDLEAATFAGDEVVAVEVVTPTADVVLNAVEIEIDEATAQTGDGGDPLVAAVNFDAEAERAALHFPSELPAGDIP